MKINKIMPTVVLAIILAIGGLKLFLKYDSYHSCRYHHNFVYCLVLG